MIFGHGALIFAKDCNRLREKARTIRTMHRDQAANVFGGKAPRSAKLLHSTAKP